MSPRIALLRYIRYGKVRWAVPHVVVEDTPELIALWLPVGTPGKAPVTDGRPIRGQADEDWPLRDHSWHTSNELRLIRPGTAHCVELLWEPETGAFKGWYVNIQEPVRRTRLGFDTDDLALDIWVEPDGAWRWKDEDELEALVAAGRFTPENAREIRAEGERVIEERPWPTGWEDWRPDPAWAAPQLPAGWDIL